MIPRKFDRILDDCLSRMDRGESLMDILAVYPAQADKIKPLLLVAMLSRAVPQPVPGYTALRVGKNQLLAEMASMQSEDSFIKPKPEKIPRERVVDRLARSLKQLQPAYRFAMVSLVVILTGGFFTLSASASGMAENIMETLFFSFEQMGDLLLVRPSPPKIMGENPIFSSDYDLPDSPDDYSGDFKGLLVDEDEKKDYLGDEYLTQIQTRVYSFTDDYEEVDLPVEDIDDEEATVVDDKDLEKDLKEEEKDLEKEEKEDDKAAEKEEKEAEKDAEKEEKDAEKEEKEDDKDKDK